MTRNLLLDIHVRQAEYGQVGIFVPHELEKEKYPLFSLLQQFDASDMTCKNLLDIRKNYRERM